MTITHQAILGRMEELRAEQASAKRVGDERREAERASLAEACGGIGHIWARPLYFSLIDTIQRRCAICGAAEGGV